MTIRQRLWFVLLACTATWVGVDVATVQAIERKPLPAFSVQAPGGTAVRSAELGTDGKWLFVYVEPSCITCDTLLRTIDQGTDPLVASRMVIVVGGVNQASIGQFAAAFPVLATAMWYADPSGSATTALKAAGTPFVVGMKQHTMQWMMTGVVPNAESAKSALVSWAGQP